MNLVEILQELKVDFRRHGEHHHVTEGWLGIDCPECSPGSGRYKLGVNLKTNKCSCWTCGRQSLPWVLKQVTGESYASLKEDCRRSTSHLPQEEENGHARHCVRMPRNASVLEGGHVAYLQRRGIDPDALQRDWRVLGISIDKRLGWRLLIPIELNGRVVSWTTRSISDKASPRYINAKPSEELLSPKDLLFGEDYCTNSILVTEGPFDVFRVGKGTVCVFGTGYTYKQLLRISKYPRRVICFDNEPEAARQAERLCKSLSVFPGETLNVKIKAKDPGSASDAEIQELRGLLK